MQKTLQAEMQEQMAAKTIFDQAREYAYAYHEQVADRNVYPLDEALANLANFNEPLPAHTGDAAAVLQQLHQWGSPATVTQTGGRYFGFVNGGVVPVGLAAKWLSVFWDQNSAMQVLSPICAKLEVVVEGWLKSLFNLPQATVAGFVSGSFAATFCGLSAARYRLLKNKGWDVNEKGLRQAPPIRIITARQAHSTVLKAIGLTGLGKESIEWVETDEQGRLITALLPKLDDSCLLVLQAGNVNSGCYEDFETICTLANQAGAWVHIDGAFGLWAAAVPSLCEHTKGIELAQSWSVDAHKTLNTPYDSGIVLCADKEALVAALHMSGDYIVTGTERDGMFFTPEMSRRARITELWAVMKYLGREGIAEMVLGLHQRAVLFARLLDQAEFTIPNDVVFNQVLVHYESDEATMAIMNTVQQMRVCWCGGSVWQNKKVIRISVCSWATTDADIEKSAASFIAAKQQWIENNTGK